MVRRIFRLFITNTPIPLGTKRLVSHKKWQACRQVRAQHSSYSRLARRNPGNKDIPVNQ